MKLGMLTQWFDPETGPAALPGVYAREFVRQGHRVRVLTGFPNYPEGRIYPGYRQTLRRTVEERGYQVNRVPLFPDHGRSSVGRSINYLSFAASASLLGGRCLAGADALWVYNSPVTVSLPLLLHSRWGRVPYFLHVQDLWPESLINSGMFRERAWGSAQVVKTIENLTRLTESRSGAIGVISPTVRTMILARNPRVNPERIHWVPNPTDEALFYPRRPDPLLDSAPWRAPFTVMYVGSLGVVQGFDTVLDAAKELLAMSHIRVVVIGDGIDLPRITKRVENEKITNVSLLGRKGKAEVPAFMASSDAQLVTLGRQDFLKNTMPSKIATILAAGLPIIGQISGDGADVIRASGAGLVSEPGDAIGLAAAICTMADMGVAERAALGGAGRAYYQANLSARAAVEAITAALSAC